MRSKLYCFLDSVVLTLHEPKQQSFLCATKSHQIINLPLTQLFLHVGEGHVNVSHIAAPELGLHCCPPD